MSKLIITRGLPASGKTSWARKLNIPRLNRDDLRRMLLPAWPYGNPDALEDAEGLLTTIQLAAARVILAHDLPVVIDDTNLSPSVVETWRQLAADYEYEFEVEDSFLNVHVDECVRRDMLRREGHVGEAVIRRMHTKHLAGAQ